MKSLYIFYTAVLLVSVLGSNAQQLNGVDDFDDNERDITKWGETDSVIFSGKLEESNARLNFVVEESGNFFDQATRTWNSNKGATTNSWVARARINVPNIPLANDGSAISYSLGMFVENGFLQTIGLNVRHFRESGVTKRQFQAVIQNGVAALEGLEVNIDRVVTTAWVQLQFDTATKIMTLEFSEEAGVPTTWNQLATYDLDSPETDFGLTDSDRFLVSLACLSVSFQVEAQHEAWSDDFMVVSRPVILEQPQSATVLTCEPATFTVEADAGPLASYQWRRATEPIEGETDSTLSISPDVVGRTSSYDVIVTNPAGFVASETAFLSTYAVDVGMSIERIDNMIHVYWPSEICPGDGFGDEWILQRSKSPFVSWEDIPKPYPESNGTWDIVFPTSGEGAFFRMINRTHSN